MSRSALKAAIAGLAFLIVATIGYFSCPIPPLAKARIAKTIEAANTKARTSVPKASELSLSLAKNGEGAFEVTLTNAGANRVRIVRPELHYSVRFRFFDGQGREFVPRTAVAISMPTRADLGEYLDQGESTSSQIERETVVSTMDYFSSAYAVASYKPSEFALKSPGVGTVDFVGPEILSNAIRW